MLQTALSVNRRKNLPNYIKPDKLWYDDLRCLIKNKLDQHHKVIVAGHFNDNLNDENGVTVTFMRNLGLREIMLESMDTEGPATYIRGKNMIDGIFATAGIQLAAGKYTSFSKSPSDHG